MASTQVAISFDTTGSMSAALDEVRARLAEMIRMLKKDIPGAELSVIAHGDYCDEDIYVTKHLDFSDDDRKLVDFVKDVEQTGGGDNPECYELVLRLVRTQLSWKRNAQKILIVIGDSYPHPPSYPLNKDRIDWKEEARLLAGIPIRIYGVQINTDSESTHFFQTITQMTGGSHLKLSEFSTLSDVILAICYRTKGTGSLKNLEKEVRARYAPKPLHKDLEAVFEVLHEPLAIPTVPAKTKKSTRAFKGKDTTFFWADELTPSHLVKWDAPNDDAYVHSLQVKLATLGPRVESNEVHLVEVETTNISDKTVKQPWIKMVAGMDNTMSIGVSFNSKVTFRLVRGQGPVYLSGQHVTVALFENGEGDEATIDFTEETASVSSFREIDEEDLSEVAGLSGRATDLTEVHRSSSDSDEADDLGAVERNLKSFEAVGTLFGLR